MFKFFKKWEDVKSTINFYRFNPHSTPGVSKVLCKMGRHDYEVAEVKNGVVILECFYCFHRKYSIQCTPPDHY